MGRAGRLRAQALSLDPRVTDVMHSSRRAMGPSFTDVLKDSVDGIALCRETERHFEDGLRILEANKHLIMEYPLGGHLSEVDALLQCAENSGLECHVGHLFLLSEWHGTVARWFQKMSLREATYWFEGGFGSAPSRLVELNAWGSLLVPRLHHLWSWLGPLEFRDVQCHRDATGFEIHLVLSSASVKRVHLVETRKNGLARRRGLYGTHIEGQEVYPSDWFRTDDLFQKDTEWALNRCSGDGTIAPLVPSEALRGVRALADTVQSAILM